MDHTVREQNGKVTLTVTHPDDRRGLYRAYAVGTDGCRCLLGTLTPSGGCLALRRTLDVNVLKQRGCYPVAAVVTELAHSFSPPPPSLPGWTTPPVQLPFADEILSAAYAGAPQKPYYRARANGFALAYPYRGNAPFPLPPLFCFAQALCLCGQTLWCFSFDEKGAPTLDA